MTESSLQALEGNIDKLISLCTALSRENDALRADSAAMRSRQKSLADKTENARRKVESIIDHLQDMEQGR